jgi:hypothetical protein
MAARPLRLWHPQTGGPEIGPPVHPKVSGRSFPAGRRTERPAEPDYFFPFFFFAGGVTFFFAGGVTGEQPVVGPVYTGLPLVPLTKLAGLQYPGLQHGLSPPWPTGQAPVL